jgi:hypothetical protein
MDPFFGPMLIQYLEHRSAKENRFPLFPRCSSANEKSRPFGRLFI